MSRRKTNASTTTPRGQRRLLVAAVVAAAILLAGGLLATAPGAAAQASLTPPKFHVPVPAALPPANLAGHAIALPSFGLDAGPKVHEVGSLITVLGQNVMKLDQTRLLARTFDVDVQKFNHSAGPYPNPWLEFSITPRGVDETGSWLLFPSRTLRPMLHLAPGQTIKVATDAAHQVGFQTKQVADSDGDGYQETMAWIPHFSNAWVTVTSSTATAFFGVTTNWDDDSVWAVGDHAIYSYSGGSWSDRTPPQLAPGSGSMGILWAVVALDHYNIIVAGDNGKLWRTTDAGTTWFQDNNGNPWNVADPTKVGISAAARSPTGNVYFAGWDGNSGYCSDTPPSCHAFVGRFDVNTGHYYQMPTGRNGQLYSIAVVDTANYVSDLWTAGSGAGTGFILHYEHNGWTADTTYGGVTFAPLMGIDPVDAYGASPDYYAGMVFAGAINGDVYLRNPSGGWSLWRAGGGMVPSSYIRAVHTSYNGVTWFAGCQGCQYAEKWRNPMPPSQLLESPIGTLQSMRGLASQGPHNVWAVGDAGVIIHYTGGPPPPAGFGSPAAGATLDAAQLFQLTGSWGALDEDNMAVDYRFVVMDSGGNMVTKCNVPDTASTLSCIVPAYAFAAGSGYSWNIAACTDSCSWAGDWRPFTLVQAPVVTMSNPGTIVSPTAPGPAINVPKATGTTYTMTGTLSNPGGTVDSATIQFKNCDKGSSKPGSTGPVPLEGQFLDDTTGTYSTGATTPTTLPLTDSGGGKAFSYPWDTTKAVGGIHCVLIATTGSGVTATFTFWVDVYNLLPGGLWTEFRDHNNVYTDPLRAGVLADNAFGSAVVNFDWGTGMGSNFGATVTGSVDAPSSNGDQLFVMDTTGAIASTGNAYIDGAAVTVSAGTGDAAGFYKVGDLLATGSHDVRLSAASSATGDRNLKLYWTKGTDTIPGVVPPMYLSYAPKDQNTVPSGLGQNVNTAWAVANGVTDLAADPDQDGLNNYQEYLYRNFGHQGEYYHDGTAPGGPNVQDLIVEARYGKHGGTTYRPDRAVLDYVRRYYDGEKLAADNGGTTPGDLPPKLLPTVTGLGIRVHVVVDDASIGEAGFFYYDASTPPTINWLWHREVDQAVNLGFAGYWGYDNTNYLANVMGIAHPLWGTVMLVDAMHAYGTNPYNCQGAGGCAGALPWTSVEKADLLHEIGHNLDVGREDDFDDASHGPHSVEVYSAATDCSDFAKTGKCHGPDPTLPANLNIVPGTQGAAQLTDRWSAMATTSIYNARATPEYQNFNNENGNNNNGVISAEWEKPGQGAATPQGSWPYTLNNKWSVEHLTGVGETAQQRPYASPVLNSATGPSLLGPGNAVLHGAVQTFTASATDPDDAHGPMTIGFDWGDGTYTTSTTPVIGNAVGSLTHAWTTPGTYTVQPYAINRVGVYSYLTMPITVTVVANFPPSIPNQISGPLDLNGPGTFSTSTVDLDGDPSVFTFNWGDGTTTASPSTLPGKPGLATHNWASPGTYFVTATAQDPSGAVSAPSKAICVVYGTGTQADACDETMPLNVGDAGETDATARPVRTGITYQGILDAPHSDAADEYAFDATQSEVVRVLVQSACCVPLTYTLYAPDGTVLDSRVATPDATLPPVGDTIQIKQITTESATQDYPLTGVPYGAQSGTYHVKIQGACTPCAYTFRVSRGPMVLLVRPSPGTMYVNDVPQDPAPISVGYATPPAPITAQIAFGIQKKEGCIQPGAQYHVDGWPHLPPPLPDLDPNYLLTATAVQGCRLAGPTVIQGDLTVCAYSYGQYPTTPWTWVAFAIDNQVNFPQPAPAEGAVRCWVWHGPTVGNHDITYAVRDDNGDVWSVTKGQNLVVSGTL